MIPVLTVSTCIGALPESYSDLDALQAFDAHGNNLTGGSQRSWERTTTSEPDVLGFRLGWLLMLHACAGPLPDWSGMGTLTTLDISSNNINGRARSVLNPGTSMLSHAVACLPCIVLRQGKRLYWPSAYTCITPESPECTPLHAGTLPVPWMRMGSLQRLDLFQNHLTGNAA